MAAEGGGAVTSASFAAQKPEEVEVPRLEAAIAAQGAKIKTMKKEGKAAEEVTAEVTELKALKAVLAAAVKAQGEAKWEVDEEGLSTTLLRKMFVVPSFEIYGSVGGLMDFGPPGAALKDAVLGLWKRHFVQEEDMLLLECTTLTPEAVLKTSGHVDKFTDLMVKDEKTGECFRADKLLEDVISNILDGKPPVPAAAKKGKKKGGKEEESAKVEELTPERKDELRRIKRQADAFSPEELDGHLRALGAVSPSSGGPLTKPFPFNLMFETRIGPEGTNVGYLRPETAQSIFMNFRRMVDYNNGKLPFAGAQIGLAFRNEISPRGGLVRVREFTMAEIEHFVDPADKSHPKFASVADDVLVLFPAGEQVSTGRTVKMTIGEAVATGLVDNEALGYFMARTARFLQQCGVSPAGIRFRQHLRTEMAHYAADCWDAELLLSQGWVETVGHADRAAFDLKVHSAKTKTDLSAERILPEPRVETKFKPKLNRGLMGSTFRKGNKIVLDALDAALADHETAARLASSLAADGFVLIPVPAAEAAAASLPLDDAAPTPCVRLTTEMMTLSEVTETITVERFTPSVIEPSFGIGRVLTAMFEHTFYTRPEDAQRGVFAFPPMVAPVLVALLQVDRRENGELVEAMRRALLDAGLPVQVDVSSVAIGRKYARADELGIPFCVTCDSQSLKDGTVTLRERDSTGQVRVPVPDLVRLFSDLRQGTTTWGRLTGRYPVVAEGKPLVGGAKHVHATIEASPDAASPTDALAAFVRAYTATA